MYLRVQPTIGHDVVDGRGPYRYVHISVNTVDLSNVKTGEMDKTICEDL